MARVSRIEDVVEWRLCIGCGACEYACQEDRIELVDLLSEGIRPSRHDDDCGGCSDCLMVCPGIETDYRAGEGIPPAALVGDDAFRRRWGPVLAVWEGHASDPLIRFEGASGGAMTAIGAYCLDVLGLGGVLEVCADPDEPVRNVTQLARTRQDLLSATGSRYSPASVCNGLGLVEEAESPCLVIGKPSEVAGLRRAMQLRPGLAKKVYASMSFFCAETPSTDGTRALVRRLGADPDSLDGLRYRGRGWPGNFAPTPRGMSEPCAEISYAESWGFLEGFRPWVTQLWPDRSGELADISCGDPWYSPPREGNPGSSLVVARTERGRQIVEGAIEAGYLELRPAEPWKLQASQGGLSDRKSILHGRRMVSRLFGIPVTRFPGLDLQGLWREVGFREKARVVLGTLRRILVRGLHRRSPPSLQGARPVPPARTASSIARTGDEDGTS